MRPRYFGVDLKHLRAPKPADPSDIADSIVWGFVVAVILLCIFGGIL